MTELCEDFGISRECGYRWLRRYRSMALRVWLNWTGMAVRHPTRRRLRSEEAVLGLRQAHMRWGPRKLKRILERDQRARLAGGEHDGRDREARGAGGGAPEASPDRAPTRSHSACGGIEPCVVRRL